MLLNIKKVERLYTLYFFLEFIISLLTSAFCFLSFLPVKPEVTYILQPIKILSLLVVISVVLYIMFAISIPLIKIAKTTPFIQPKNDWVYTIAVFFNVVCVFVPIICKLYYDGNSKLLIFLITVLAIVLYGITGLMLYENERIYKSNSK